MSEGTPPPPPDPSTSHPPPAPQASSAMEAGAIYVRWKDRLWQEQPDGSYLLWNEESHQWETSEQQPPRTGKTVATRECPNCGRRVKVTLRSCPYCEYGFEQPSRPPTRSGETIIRKSARDHVRPAFRWSRSLLVVVLLLVGASLMSFYLIARSRACDSWKAGVRAFTTVTITSEGLPNGMTRRQLQEFNEDRFAERKPGGCG